MSRFITYLKRSLTVNVNTEDTDLPGSTAALSDLGLHCLVEPAILSNNDDHEQTGQGCPGG